MPVNPSTDALLLSRLHAECFTDSWSQTSITDMLVIANTLGWIYNENNVTKSFSITRNIADEHEILTLGTLPKYRNKGYAKRLIRHIIDKLPSGDTLFLDVSKNNQNAIDLYHSCGFIIYNQRKNYYKNADGTRSTAILMRYNKEH